MRPTKKEILVYQHDIKSIAQEYNVTEQTVRRWLIFYEIYQPRKGYGSKNIPHNTVVEIRKLADRYTQKELGLRFGLSQAMIGRIINNVSHRIDIRFGANAEIKVGFYA